MIINFSMPYILDKMAFRNFLAITISPKITNGSVFYKYDQDAHWLQRSLRRCSKHFTIWPEFDKNDRLHYHGIIRIDDKTKWYKSTRRKMQLMGFCKFDHLKDFTNYLTWLQYCKKDYYKNVDMFKYIKYKANIKQHRLPRER